MRRLPLLLFFLALAATAAAQPGPSQEPMKPLTREPHIFYEPQARYPPQGAEEAFRSALPAALGLSLAAFALAFFATRPIPELALALEARRQARAARPEAPAPEEPAPPAPALPAGPPPANGPVLAAPILLPPRPAFRPPRGGPEAPPESPLRPFSFPSADRRLPLFPQDRVVPGLVACLAPPDLRPRLQAALVAWLLREEPGAVISVGGAPEEVAEELVRAETGRGLEGLGPEERLALLRSSARRLDRLTRRLYLPGTLDLPPERLLRGAARLEGRQPLAGVVADSAALARSQERGGEPPPTHDGRGGEEIDGNLVATRRFPGVADQEGWLRVLHEAAGQGGFPLLLVADPGEVPLPTPGERPWLGRALRFESLERAVEAWPSAGRVLESPARVPAGA